MNKNDIIEKFIKNSISFCINSGATRKNYKIKIRNYLKNIFSDSEYNTNEIIQEAQQKAKKIFEED